MPVDIEFASGESSRYSRATIIESLIESEVSAADAEAVADSFIRRFDETDGRTTVSEATRVAEELSTDLPAARLLAADLSIANEPDKPEGFVPAGPATAPAMVLHEIYGKLPNRRVRRAYRTLIRAAEAVVHGEVRSALPAIVETVGEVVRSTETGATLPETFEATLQQRAAAVLGDTDPALALWQAGQALAFFNEEDGSNNSLEKKTEKSIVQRYTKNGLGPEQLKALPNAPVYPPNTPQNRSGEARYAVWLKAASLERRTNLNEKPPLWCRKPSDEKGFFNNVLSRDGDELEAVEYKIGKASPAAALETPEDAIHKRQHVTGKWEINLTKPLFPGDFLVIEEGISVATYGWLLSENDQIGSSSFLKEMTKKAHSALEEKQAELTERGAEKIAAIALGFGGKVAEGIAKALGSQIIKWIIELTLRLLDPNEQFPTVSLYHVTQLIRGKVPVSWVLATETSLEGEKPATRLLSMANARLDADDNVTLDDTFSRAYRKTMRRWFGDANRLRATPGISAITRATRKSRQCVVWSDVSKEGMHCMLHQTVDDARYVVAMRAETFGKTPEEARELDVSYADMTKAPTRRSF